MKSVVYDLQHCQLKASNTEISIVYLRVLQCQQRQTLPYRFYSKAVMISLINYVNRAKNPTRMWHGCISEAVKTHICRVIRRLC